jgi:hypothetical protein
MNKSAVIESIIKDLESGDETAIIGALEKIPEKGNHLVIEPLLECYDDTSNEIIKHRIQQVLCELKDTACIDPLMDYFRIADTSTREVIVNAFWNNNLSPYTYIDVFIDAAINGSYMECFETLTLLENMDADYSDIEFKHMIADLDDAIEEEQDAHKLAILKSIVTFLKQIKPEHDK